MLTQFSRLVFASVFVSASSLAACSGGNTGNAPTSAAAGAKSEAVQVARLPFLDHALNSDAVALRPEQRTALEAVRTDLVSKTADARREAKALAEILAKDVEGGKFDRAEVDAQIAKLVAATDANKPAFQDAMTKVHDILDQGQRKALIESMHAGARGEKGKHHEGRPGHEGGGFGFRKEMEELNLTTAQRDALHTAMKAQHEATEGKDKKPDGQDWKAMKTHMKETADAFVSDKFDAKTVDVGMGRMGGARFATHAARFVEVAIPILDAPQRAILAKQIRARAAKIPV
jgi:Spy/CpxP family protein refolding chaperone